MRVSSYTIGAPLADERFFVLLHGLRGSMDKVSASTGSYLVEHAGNAVVAAPWSAGDRTETHLRERGYLTELSEDNERQLMVEVATALHKIDLAANPPSFVFVPAYICNLRCPYCFQSHEMHAGKGAYAAIMTRERVDDAFRVIDNFNSPGELARQLNVPSVSNASKEEIAIKRRIGLFGGEPLAEGTRDIVEQIVEHCRSRGLGMWAITNGVELDLFTDLLGPDGIVELQITLDGMPDIHDQRRVGPRFRKTFHRIIKNIDHALELGAHVSIRINVDQSNADHVAMLNDLFIERGWSKHAGFSASAAVVTGEAKHKSLMSQGDLVELTSALGAGGTGCVSSYEGYARGVVTRALAGGYPFHTVAHCSAETGLLMFDPSGDLYGCWEEVGQVSRKIGRYDGGILDLNEKIALPWLSRFVGAIEQCSHCAYALIHTGGCGNHARNGDGSMFAAACEGFQAYFPRTLSESYYDIEQQLLEIPSAIHGRRRTRNLPIVQVTNSNSGLAMKEVLS